MKNYKWWQDNERYIPDPRDEIAKFEQELKQMAITESALRECIEKLERENAALREDKARLVKTANEVLESLILHLRVEANHPCPENLVICRELQAAIDTARKEAQP